MWQKSYRDYPKDEPLVKQKVEAGKGITGCEMHDLNGWGESWHCTRQKKTRRGIIRTFLEGFFNFFKKKERE